MPCHLSRLRKRTAIQTLGLILISGACLVGESAEFTKPKWHDELVSAIKANNVASVERVYSTNSLTPETALNVNASTSLMVASSLGSLDVVKWLLSRGANVKARTILEDPEKSPGVADCTALHLACARNHVEVAKVLIEHGADLNQQDGSGNSSFILACAKGHLETIQLLIKHGANVEMPNGNGWTPLLVAVDQDQVAAAKFFISQGANINAEYPNGRNALMKAAELGNEQLVNLFIEKGADVNHTNSSGANALIDAAVAGHDKVVKLLIQGGAKLDRRDGEGWTALIKAAAHGHCETVKVLCAAGANPAATNKFGRTGFDYARGITGTNVLTKTSNLQPLIDSGSIAPEDLYYAMLRVAGEGDFDCVTKVLADYNKRLPQKPTDN